MKRESKITMSIRPFFWLLLALTCSSILIFALLVPISAPLAMRVHLDQSHPRASEVTSLTLDLTDPQGLPIERAHVALSANMTTMDMQPPPEGHVQEVGQGTYVVHFQLSMSGPWAITVLAHAAGFASLQKSLTVEAV